MRQSGFDKIVTQKRLDSDFIYGGYSAGVCVLSPTLRGIHLADNPDTVPNGYSRDIIWEGLGIIDFYVAPHYRSNHKETEMIEATVQFYIDNKMLFVALRDGDVLTLDSEEGLAQHPVQPDIPSG